jgi:hypothetical protein
VAIDYAIVGWLCDIHIAAPITAWAWPWPLPSARDQLSPCGLYCILLAVADAHGVHAREGFGSPPQSGKRMALGSE